MHGGGSIRCALNSTMTPVPENPVASERRRADALVHLTNNRSNAFQADGYRGFTSRRNSAPSSTPARPSVQPTSASASRPPATTKTPSRVVNRSPLQVVHLVTKVPVMIQKTPTSTVTTSMMMTSHPTQTPPSSSSTISWVR